MSATQVTEMLSRVESNLEKGLYAEAKTGQEEILGLLDAHALILDSPTGARFVRTLRELAGYELVFEKEESYERAQNLLDKAMKAYPLDPELICEQGLLYLSRPQFNRPEFESAAAAFERVANEIQASEDQRRLAFQWASAAQRRRFHPVAANRLVEQAATLFGRDTTGVATELAWLHHDGGRYQIALAGFDRVLASEADAGSATVGRLCCLHLTNERQSAQCIEGLKSRLPVNRILTLLGKCADIHQSFSRYAAELIARDQMIDLDRDNPYLHEAKVEVLRNLRNYDDAEKFCRASQTRFPKCPGLQLSLGWIYYQQHKYKEAHQELTSPLLSGNDLAAAWEITALRRMYKTGEAMQKIDEGLSRSPDDSSFWEEKGAVYYAKRRYEEAIESFERSLVADPQNAFALRWRIASYRKLEKLDRAHDLAIEAIDRLSGNAELRAEQGWLFFDKETLEEADKAFRNATELDPYDASIWFGRTEILLRLGRISEPRSILESLNVRFPNDTEIEERLGWFYLGQNEPLEAERVFRAMLERDPANVAGINGLGGVYLDRQDYQSAIAQFKDAVERVDYEPQYHVNLAWALVRQASEGKLALNVISFLGVKKFLLPETLLEKGEKRCNTALKLDPFSAKAMECLGVIAFKRGRFLAAEDYFRASIRADPQLGGHVDLAALYTQMGRYGDGAACLATALKLNKNDARALIEMANVQLAKGESSRSLTACRQAVMVDPRNDEGYRALAIALMRAGQFGEAERVLRNAIECLDESRRWRIHLLLSQVLVRLGDDANKDRAFYGDALSQVNAARRIKFGNEEVHFHAGVVKHKLEDYVAARRSFEDCFKANPQRFDAERNARLAKQMIKEVRRVNRINYWGGLILASFCASALILLWVFFLTGWRGKVESSLITFMTPLLLGLIIVALLLPNLNKLKLPGGFEAEISEPKPKDISSGPKGEIGFGSSQEAISPGPR